MQLSITKHRPVQLSSESSHLSASIQTRLNNELLELEEFKSYSVKVVTTFYSSLQSQINSFSTALQNQVLSKCKKLEDDIKLSISRLIINETTPILELFRHCETAEEVKLVKVCDKFINCDESPFNDLLSDSIRFTLDTLYDTEELPKRRSSAFSQNLTFSEPVKGHHFPKAFVPYLFCFVPGTNRLEFFNVKDYSFGELDIDGECFRSLSSWCVSEDSKVVLTGGINETATKHAYIYNISRQRLEKIPSMNVPRYNHSMISIGCYIYVIGGRYLNTLKECERLSLHRTEWSLFSKLNVAREYPSVSHHSGKLYVFGGSGVQSIEYCSIKSPSFSLLNLRLPSPGRCCSFTYDSEIYLILKTGVIKFLCQEEKIEKVKDWVFDYSWTSCEPVVRESSAFWITEGRYLGLSLDTLSISTLK